MYIAILFLSEYVNIYTSIVCILYNLLWVNFSIYYGQYFIIDFILEQLWVYRKDEQEVKNSQMPIVPLHKFPHYLHLVFVWYICYDWLNQSWYIIIH